jgi:hypothetical protein
MKMAYSPTTWNTNDVITKDKLNKIEQGVKTATRLSGTDIDADKDWGGKNITNQRGSTLEAVTVAKLVDSIPVTAQEGLETYLNEDLRGAVVSDSVPVVDDDGKIFLGEIILRLEDGRKVAIVPEMRGM